MEKEKAIELGKFLFTELRGDMDTASVGAKRLVLNELIKIDIEPERLKSMMIEYKKRFPEKAKHVSNPHQIIKALSDPDNLMKTAFYYHPRLLVPVGMPKLKQLDSGEFIEEYSDVLNIKNIEKFTYMDACRYFHEQIGSKMLLANRDLAGMRILLEACEGNLDILLYTIDAVTAKVQAHELRITSPIQALDHIGEGKTILDNRINSWKQAGLDNAI